MGGILFNMDSGDRSIITRVRFMSYSMDALTTSITGLSSNESRSAGCDQHICNVYARPAHHHYLQILDDLSSVGWAPRPGRTRAYRHGGFDPMPRAQA